MYLTKCRVPENSKEGQEAFFNEQCKEIKENNRRGKNRDLFKKLKITKENFMQRWAQ